MIAFLSLFLHVLISPFKTQARLEAEIVLLRHQLNVLRRRIPSRPEFGAPDRLLLVWSYRLFPSVLNAVTIVQLETIIRWHRMGFWLSRGGRPKVPLEIRLCLLKSATCHGIGLPKKALADNFGLSKSAVLSCDPVCADGSERVGIRATQ